jgi:hypothetical protein
VLGRIADNRIATTMPPMKTWSQAMDTLADAPYAGAGEVMEGERMTEAEWLTCCDTLPMLRVLEGQGKLSLRRSLLFAATCVRRTFNLLVDPRSQAAVETAEQYAEGQVSDAERIRVSVQAQTATDIRTRAMDARKNTATYWASWAAHCASGAARALVSCECLGATHAAANALAASSAASTLASTPHRLRTVAAARAWHSTAFIAERTVQSQLLRHVFGNPFCPVSIDPAWLSRNDGTIRRLAEAIYQERAFDRMPILSDALEDAGCTDPAILEHLRGPGPHCRGCWVVDLLLDKK